MTTKRKIDSDVYEKNCQSFPISSKLTSYHGKSLFLKLSTSLPMTPFSGGQSQVDQSHVPRHSERLAEKVNQVEQTSLKGKQVASESPPV